MQPNAQNSPSQPKGPLAWGQLNFLHTTDTHGWLEGHIKEQNYGADWGDYKSFITQMRQKSDSLNVDLLVVDTGDLHDGNGDTDATTPNGVKALPIYEQLDYDVLTIGNHELYLSDITYLTATNYAKYYGDKYISSNVQIFNNATGQYEYFANQYRYFTTKHGLRIMAFGVLFDFTGNSNASKVIKGATMVQQPWFINAVNYPQPIDLFLLIGHNPVRGSGSTLTTVQSAIRKARPDVPVQIFGGHTHIRDFSVYDAGTTALESGRYCETLGWLSMSGIKSSNYTGAMNPAGVPNPTTPAMKNATASATASAAPTSSANSTAFANLRYFRRYLDWNRATFAYHAVGSQSNTFDTKTGISVSNSITSLRKQLNLTTLYGCAPQTWCQSCQPFMSSGNIFSLLATALSATVVNQNRSSVPRLILINTGSVRFDLVEGPFTYDDSFIVSPFHDTFQYIPNVPYSNAKQVLGILNGGAYQKRELSTRDFGFTSTGGGDSCVDAALTSHAEMLSRRSSPAASKRQKTRGIVRRQNSTILPGYVTSDDFGKDGDDTVHSAIPYYSQPNDLQANASFPTDGSSPQSVDLIFLDFIGSNYVIPALQKTGANYTKADIQQYLDPSFDTNSYLPAYAKMAWQANVPNCPVGKGVGY